MDRQALINEMQEAEATFRENVAAWRARVAQARTEAGTCADALAAAERVAAEARRGHQAAEDRVNHAEQRVRELHGQRDQKVATLRKRLVESAPAPVAEYLRDLQAEALDLRNRKPSVRTGVLSENYETRVIGKFSNAPSIAARVQGLQRLVDEVQRLLAQHADGGAVLLEAEALYAALPSAEDVVEVGREEVPRVMLMGW